MTVATRVLEMILPIEPVPDGDRRSRGPFRENEVPSRGPGGARARQQALVRASVPPRCALSRGPELAAAYKPPSHGAHNARTRLN